MLWLLLSGIFLAIGAAIDEEWISYILMAMTIAAAGMCWVDLMNISKLMLEDNIRRDHNHE